MQAGRPGTIEAEKLRFIGVPRRVTLASGPRHSLRIVFASCPLVVLGCSSHDSGHPFPSYVRRFLRDVTLLERGTGISRSFFGHRGVLEVGYALPGRRAYRLPRICFMDVLFYRSRGIWRWTGGVPTATGRAGRLHDHNGRCTFQ